MQTAKITTPEVLRHVKDVIAKTTVPAWVGSVPKNFGDSAAGVLKADEWRTLSTIYLPIALIFLWGEGSKHSSVKKAERLRQVLDHTMHLVSVIILALKRAASQSRSGFYLDEMVAYLSDLQNIHPDASFRPYHHLSMHLPHFFDLFGPARCFWTYPFERLIYQIQRLLSNHKLG